MATTTTPNQRTPIQDSSSGSTHQDPLTSPSSSSPSRQDGDQEQVRLLKKWTQHLNFPSAAQPEIIRADQKDDYLVDLLQDRIEPLVRAFKGSRWSNQHSSELHEASKLIYLLLTTLPGSQTLGEEYCDIVKVDTFTNDFPNIYRRFILIIVQVFSPRLLTRVSNYASGYVTRRWNDDAPAASTSSESNNDEDQGGYQANHMPNSSSSNRYEKLKSLKKKIISTLGHLVTSLDRSTTLDTLNALHLSLFYLTGRYFRWTNRFNGITYISNRVRPLRPDGLGRVSPPSYEILGVLIMAQLVIKMGSKYQERKRRLYELKQVELEQEIRLTDPNEEKNNHLNKEINNKKVIPTVDGRLIDDLVILPDHHQNLDDEPLEVAPEGILVLESPDSAGSRRCTLCLGPRKHQASLECGHLFCWNCVVLWVKEKPECPLCRHSVRIVDLLPLYNF